MKKTVHDNYHLIIKPVTTIPDGFSRRELTNEEIAGVCADIKAAISRHVDDVGYVTVKFTSTEVCSFCGHGWSEITEGDITGPASCFYDEHSIPGEPACCDEAIAEFRTKRGIPHDA